MRENRKKKCDYNRKFIIMKNKQNWIYYNIETDTQSIGTQRTYSFAKFKFKFSTFICIHLHKQMCKSNFAHNISIRAHRRIQNHS